MALHMDLAVEKREHFGRAIKSIREGGLIPAELYGNGVENLHLSVPIKEFRKLYKEAGESTLINLLLDGGKDRRPVMIHDVARDPVTADFLSVDFYQVNLNEKITVNVPLEFVGISQAVKDGGVLVKAVQELAVEALPTEIPQKISVDISAMQVIGDSIHVKDLNIDKRVKVSIDLATVVATITAKMTEEEEAKLATETDVSAVKTEGEEKRAEKEKEAATEAEVAPAEPKA